LATARAAASAALRNIPHGRTSRLIRRASGVTDWPGDTPTGKTRPRPVEPSRATGCWCVPTASTRSAIPPRAHTRCDEFPGRKRNPRKLPIRDDEPSFAPALRKCRVSAGIVRATVSRLFSRAGDLLGYQWGVRPAAGFRDHSSQAQRRKTGRWGRLHAVEP